MGTLYSNKQGGVSVTVTDLLRVEYMGINNTGGIAVQTVYRVELKVDIDPAREDAHEVIREACRDAARTLFAQALLVSGKRKPQIAVHGDTFFEDTAQIKVFDDEEG